MADGNPIIIGQANTGSNETSLSRNQNTAATVFVARNVNLGDGIHGEAGVGTGVTGTSDSGAGVVGNSTSPGGTDSFSSGVEGRCSNPYAPGVSGIGGFGVTGTSPGGPGTFGISDSGPGVWGTSNEGEGVNGTSDEGHGVRGRTSGEQNASGVRGDSADGFGVSGRSTNSYGVVGASGGAFAAGVLGIAEDLIWGWAGYFHGDVAVYEGNLSVQGVFDATTGNTLGGNITNSGPNKSFRIDHPLDPENKYLFHNAVEAPERKNVYDGVAELEGDGTVWVDLPEWFEALNGDFRYQLTAVGGPAPNLHVAEEISENSQNRFKIAGGEEGMKVCWQVTGTRKDPLAAANPFEVEQEKPEEERGRYLYPSLYDAPEEQAVMIRPLPEGVAEEQRPPEPGQIRAMEELRRRMEEHEEEAPPEST